MLIAGAGLSLYEGLAHEARQAIVRKRPGGLEGRTREQDEIQSRMRLGLAAAGSRKSIDSGQSAYECSEERRVTRVRRAVWA